MVEDWLKIVFVIQLLPCDLRIVLVVVGYMYSCGRSCLGQVARSRLQMTLVGHGSCGVEVEAGVEEPRPPSMPSSTSSSINIINSR